MSVLIAILLVLTLANTAALIFGYREIRMLKARVEGLKRPAAAKAAPAAPAAPPAPSAEERPRERSAGGRRRGLLAETVSRVNQTVYNAPSPPPPAPAAPDRPRLRDDPPRRSDADAPAGSASRPAGGSAPPPTPLPAAPPPPASPPAAPSPPVPSLADAERRVRDYTALLGDKSARRVELARILDEAPPARGLRIGSDGRLVLVAAWNDVGVMLAFVGTEERGFVVPSPELSENFPSPLGCEFEMPAEVRAAFELESDDGGRLVVLAAADASCSAGVPEIVRKGRLAGLLTTRRR